MDSRELALLEKAYEAEVSGALAAGPRLLQTRSKLADKLVLQGYLRQATVTVGAGPAAVRVQGFELTDAGRLAYCTSDLPPLEDGS